MANPLLKILVSRLKFIGDIVLTTPVIEVLREKFPGGEIHYLGDKHGVSLLENNPALDRIIPYEFERSSVAEQLRTSVTLRHENYDVVVDLFGNPRSAVLTYLSGAKMRIGGDFGWRGRLYTHPLRITERMTAVEFHLRYLRPLGISERFRAPRIYLTGAEIEGAREFLSAASIDRSRPLVGLHIGATWPAKVWPSKNFARVADLISEWLGARVVITHGPGDGDYFKEFAAAVNGSYADFSPRELRKLAAVISCCDVFVSNDAAPMHMAAALGVPTVGIFGPGEPDIWFPYDAALGHVALKKDVDCCHRDFCNLTGDDYMRCMKLIKPEDVYDAVGRILKNRKRADQ
jgi:lipopolysaccharide heptosyltransferase III